jgi:acyl-coenzyme A thioesterase PaaI-like protein
VDELGPALTDPSMIVLPAHSRLDPSEVLSVSVRTNAAHAAMGTELLHVGDRSAVLRLRWRPELAGPDARRWANGVLTALLDHVCSLTGVLTLDDAARFGGTMGLRVEYGPPAVDVPVLVARARGDEPHAGVLRVQGIVHAAGAPDVVFAAGRCTVAVVA